jgi:hypothetical protein
MRTATASIGGWGGARYSKERSRRKLSREVAKCIKRRPGALNILYVKMR